MKNKILHFLFLIGIIISVILSGCKDDTKIPDEFFPEKYFNLETAHELNIGMNDTFNVVVNASSTWEVSTSSTWCHFKKSRFSGRDTLIVDVDANRGAKERSCYIKFNTFFRDNPIVDSILVVQPINTSPVLEISPSENMDVFYKGATYALKATYNNGIDFNIEYISGGDDWIQVTPNEFEISESVITTDIEVVVLPNETSGAREADLVFVNTKDKKTCKIHVKQSFQIPAITSFADDFETSTTTGQPYIKDGWNFQSQPNGTLLFKQFNNSARALLINGNISSKATGYAVFPVFNIKDMIKKEFSYTWGAGNKNPADRQKGDIFELVASVDYEGDAFNATWVQLQDLTNTAETPAISLPNNKVSIDLGATQFANSERVYLALRYVGGGHAYRFDNLKIGDVVE